MRCTIAVVALLAAETAGQTISLVTVTETKVTTTTLTTTHSTSKETTKVTTTKSKESTTKTKATTTSIKWQASGGVSCPHPSVNTVWPSPSGSTSFPTASVVPLDGVFDGQMSVFDRRGSAGDCHGQAELDEEAAVFILEPGATLKNVIIGSAQAEGVHCRGSCTLENVWWDDVCEDAATFKGNGTRYVNGGGAREASDKIFQHNGQFLLAPPGHRSPRGGSLNACADRE